MELNAAKLKELLEDEQLHTVVGTDKKLTVPMKHKIKNVVTDYVAKKRRKEGKSVTEGDMREIATVISTNITDIPMQWLFIPKGERDKHCGGTIYHRVKNQKHSKSQLTKSLSKGEPGPSNAESPLTLDNRGAMLMLSSVSSRNAHEQVTKASVQECLAITKDYRHQKIVAMKKLKALELLRVAEEVMLPIFFLNEDYVSLETYLGL